MTSESDVLSHLKRQEVLGGLGIGDDAAFIPDDLLVTVDALVAGVHYDDTATVSAVAQKLVRVNVSDIAAMGGVPTWCLLTLAMADGFDYPNFLKALQEECEDWKIRLVGGDTVRSGNTVLSLTLMGSIQGTPAYRRGASAGDVVFVTGALGGAVSSGRHLSFKPRLEEGQWLVKEGVRCLIDLSDGLAKGLHLISEESGVSLVIESCEVPLHKATEHLNFQDRLSSALFEGEDFELLGSASQDVFERIKRGPYELTKIGLAQPGQGVVLESENGEQELLLEKGYGHQWT